MSETSAGALRQAPSLSAFLSVGFRPFYLAGSLFAALSILLWVGALAGAWVLDPVGADARDWHAHELLFGFAPAILAGFLFTAVQEWTGRPVARGGPLLGLLFLWFAGRVAIGFCPPPAAAVVDMLFLPAIAVAVLRALLLSGNRRNLVIVVAVLALAACNLWFHLDRLGIFPTAEPDQPFRLAIDFFIIIITIIGGRVIPLFHDRAVGSGPKARRWRPVEALALGGLVALAIVDIVAPSGAGWRGSAALLATIIAAAHMVRWIGWRPWRGWREPLLWCMSLGYVWLPVGLVFRAMAFLDVAPAVAAAHVFTVGAISGMMMAIMTRSARGHTGRALVADAADSVMYLLIWCGALVRVLTALSLAPAMSGYLLSALCWGGAFGLFALRYGPMLIRPRPVDGAG